MPNTLPQSHRCGARLAAAATDFPSDIGPAVATQQSCAILASDGLELPPHIAREAHAPRVQAQLPCPWLRKACPLPCLVHGEEQLSHQLSLWGLSCVL